VGFSQSRACLLAGFSLEVNMANTGVPSSKSGGGSGQVVKSKLITQTAHGFAVDQVVYKSSVAGAYALAQADSVMTAEAIGVVTGPITANTFYIESFGLHTVTNAAFLPLPAEGSSGFLSATIAGAITYTEPTSPNVSQPIWTVTSANTVNVDIKRGVVAAPVDPGVNFPKVRSFLRDDLALLTATDMLEFANGQLVQVTGNSIVGDSGRTNFWQWDSTSIAPVVANEVIQVTGIVTGRFLKKRPLLDDFIFDITEYGALPTATDNATAINAAITAASNALLAGRVNPVLLFPPGGSFRSSVGIVVPINIDVRMESPLIYTGGLNVTALRIGMTAAETISNSLQFRDAVNETRIHHLWVNRLTTSDGTNEASVGIHILSAFHNKIFIRETLGFTRNIVVQGDRWGATYNDFHLGRMNGAKVSLDLIATKVGADFGWVNENHFWGGHFAMYAGGAFNTRSRIGVRIRWDQELYINNNNTFYSPSFEMQDAAMTGGATSIPFETLDATLNTVLNARHETALSTGTVIFAKETGTVGSYNSYNVSYHDRPETIDYSGSTAPRASTINQRNAAFAHLTNDRYTQIFSTGRLRDFLQTPPTGTGLTLSDKAFFITPAGVVSNRSALVTQQTDHLKFTGSVGIGVHVSTRFAKNFFVRRNVNNGTLNGAPGYGRVFIRPFDSAGALLDGSGATRYVSGPDAGLIAWSTTYGGAYLCANDGFSENIGPFNVDASVAYIQVGVYSSNMELIGFDIVSMDSRPAIVWSGVTAPTDLVAASYKKVFDTGFLPNKATAYDATTYSVAGLGSFVPGTGVVTLNATGVTVAPTQTNFAAPGAAYFGIFIDTSKAKQLRITRKCANSRAGRVRIAAFDNTGVRLTGGTDVAAVPSMFYSGAAINMYVEAADNTGVNSMIVNVGATVDRIFVAVTGGTNPAEMLRWEVETLGESTAYSGLDGALPNDGQPLAVQAPVNGIYVLGVQVQNATPSELGAATTKYVVTGWVCTAAGAPGTWLQQRALTGN
jgi:hypothetical protein